nr:MAG TPA: hypothetical protein [Caudoviricetes sp.]
MKSPLHQKKTLRLLLLPDFVPPLQAHNSAFLLDSWYIHLNSHQSGQVLHRR